MTQQLIFDGMDVAPWANMDLQERVAMIMEMHEDARNHDNVLVLRCLWEFDGLHTVLDEKQYGSILEWAATATSFETYRRRRQEIQKNRDPARGRLRPEPGEEQRRRDLDGAGPPMVRRKRRR